MLVVLKMSRNEKQKYLGEVALVISTVLFYAFKEILEIWFSKPIPLIIAGLTIYLPVYFLLPKGRTSFIKYALLIIGLMIGTVLLDRWL
jgi:hypothetical protein